MTSHPILAHGAISDKKNGSLGATPRALDRSVCLLPRFVRRSALAMHTYRLLGPIDWAALPERNLSRNYGQPTVPYAAFVAAYLKIDQRLVYMSDLRRFLVEHPALCWWIGLPIRTGIGGPSNAQADACLPTERHLARMLRQISNACLQALLDQTVALLRAERIDVCPIDDPHWAKDGCATTLATSIGARTRHPLDRDSAAYKPVYKQPTATERINALAKELGIERPKLRNRAAIANQNTLIDVLLNLRALQRVRQRKAEPS